MKRNKTLWDGSPGAEKSVVLYFHTIHHWHNVVQILDHMVFRKMAGAFNRLKMNYQRKLMSQPKRSQDTSDSIKHDFDTEKGKSRIVVTA